MRTIILHYENCRFSSRLANAAPFFVHFMEGSRLLGTFELSLVISNIICDPRLSNAKKIASSYLFQIQDSSVDLRIYSIVHNISCLKCNCLARSKGILGDYCCGNITDNTPFGMAVDYLTSSCINTSLEMAMATMDEVVFQKGSHRKLF